MVTVLRAGGLRVVIYIDDQGPPHVHVYGDGETKIVLGGPGRTESVIRIVGAGRGESRRALAIVREHRLLLLERWEEMHGRPD